MVMPRKSKVQGNGEGTEVLARLYLNGKENASKAERVKKLKHQSRRKTSKTNNGYGKFWNWKKWKIG